MNMRKWFVACIVAVMILLNAAGVMAAADIANFSHPEVGEFMTVWVVDGHAYFEIYGFTYYSIVNPETPYRGMYVNQLQLINEQNVDYEQSMEKLLSTVEGNPDYPVLSLFEYRGAAGPYNEQLARLDRADRIKALRIINGFDGAEGFDALKGIPGFEGVDVQPLKDAYLDYFVTIDGVRYPYRAQAFYFEEQDDWYECYNEKYGYVQVDGVWKLIRITKEYADEYKQRAPYIHGISGSMPETLNETNDEALRGVRFGMSVAEAEALLGVKAKEGAIELEGEKLYRLPCKAIFRFENEQMSKVDYVFENAQSFYSAFISLYIRYNDPVTLNADGDMTWCQNNMTVSLTFDAQSPSLSFTPAE